MYKKLFSYDLEYWYLSNFQFTWETADFMPDKLFSIPLKIRKTQELYILGLMTSSALSQSFKLWSVQSFYLNKTDPPNIGIEFHTCRSPKQLEINVQ